MKIDAIERIGFEKSSQCIDKLAMVKREKTRHGDSF